MPFLGLLTKTEQRQIMTELDALKAQVKRSAELEKWLLPLADAQQFNIPDPAVYDNQAELFRVLSWVVQAVEQTASAAALSELSVKRVIRDKEPKDIPNHPFELLIRKPNEVDSRYEFIFGTVALWMLNGNVYWFNNAESEDASPDELWIIPPAKISPVPDGKMYLKGYMYYPGNGSEVFLQPWQIVHFKRFNPFNPFVGLSAVESIAMISRGDIAMQGWNTRLFAENNARLPGILTFEQMIADPQWDKIKGDTREASKKRELLMLRGVGQGGVNWIQNAVSQKEMEFLEGRKFNKEEIMGTLAPGLYSMLSENSTEANSRTGAAAFMSLSVYPKHVIMAERITKDILPKYGGRELICEFEDVRIADKQMELDEQRMYSETHTLAEIREQYYGDEPLGDERDDLLPSQIKVSSGGIVEEPAPEPMQRPEMEEAENEQPEEPEENEVVKMALDELSKWERKALKRIGQRFEFTTDYLDDATRKYITLRLPSCSTADAVKSVFTSARMDVKPARNEALIVLDGLRAVLENT